MRRRGVIAVLCQAWRLVGFAGFFVWDLLASNAALTWDIVTPSSRVAPGVAYFPLRCRSPFEIALLADLISLTPGMLVLEVRRGPAALLVHGMYAPDPEDFRRRLRALEHRLLAAVRRDGDVPDLKEAGGGTA